MTTCINHTSARVACEKHASVVVVVAIIKMMMMVMMMMTGRSGSSSCNSTVQVLKL